MITLTLEGELTESEPVALLVKREGDEDPVCRVEFQPRHSVERHRIAIARAACLAHGTEALKENSAPVLYMCDAEWCDLPSLLGLPAQWYKVFPEHVGWSRDLPSGPTNFQVGDIVFQRGRSPLHAIRVHTAGMVPTQDKTGGVVKEYALACRGSWLRNLEEAPLLLWRDVDSHTSVGEYYEHLHLNWQVRPSNN